MRENRSPVGRIVWALACLVFSAAGAAGQGYDTGKRQPTSWDIALARAGERGERFELSGQALDAAGSGMPGVRIFAYHADARGDYGPPFPRLSGVLRTDSLGRYRLRTVIPGNYEGYDSHVHFEMSGQAPPFFVVNVFQPPDKPDPRRAQEPYLDMHRDPDGVWRARWDIGPGARNPLVRGVNRAQALRNGPSLEWRARPTAARGSAKARPRAAPLTPAVALAPRRTRRSSSPSTPASAA